MSVGGKKDEERGKNRKGQDDVTALNYPQCFAGKMNEVGHKEGVKDDTAVYICILIS